MKKNIQKIFEIIIIVIIIAISIAIFVYRDQIENVGSIGYLGLFGLCFLSNATVLFPAPGLMIVVTCAMIMNPLIVSLVGALGTTLGELVGYAFGTVTKELSPGFKCFVEKAAEKVHYPTLVVFILAVLPLPIFDVVGIYSGGVRMHLAKFFVACFIGKFIKMLVFTRMYDVFEWATSLI